MLSVIIFGGMTLGILTHSGLAGSYVLEGLNVWYQYAIPALFPFMVLSGIMIKLGLAERAMKIFTPLLGRLYQTNPIENYVILIGFLCGFPMGARTIAQLIKEGKLSQRDAKWLLSFCNNLGPAYIIGYLFPLLGFSPSPKYLFGIYGLPLIYGWVLRRTYYCPKKHAMTSIEKDSVPGNKTIGMASFGSMIWMALRESIESAIKSLLTLGGYLVFFCLLNFFPRILFQKPQPILGLLFEITTGLKAMQGKHPVMCLCAATFGGFSCMAQTHEALSCGMFTEAFDEYVLHKVVLTAITFVYFYACLILI